MDVLYMVESWASFGMLQSGTRAQDTDLRQDTLARRRAPHDGSCTWAHEIQHLSLKDDRTYIFCQSINESVDNEGRGSLLVIGRQTEGGVV